MDREEEDSRTTAKTRSAPRDLVWLAVPLLFAAWWPVGFYAQNVDQMAVGSLLSTLAIAAAAAVVLAGLAFAIYRRPEPAALTVSAAFVLFYSYGFVYLWATTTVPGVFKRLANLGIGADAALIALAVAVLAGIAWAVARRRAPVRELVRVAAAAGATMLLLAAFQSVSANASASKARTTAKPPVSAEPTETASSKPATRSVRPDIYYLILDTYMGHDELLKLTGYDNTPFLDSLRRAGFYVAEDAHSDYSITYTAIASTMNMRYLDDYLDLPGYQKRDDAKQANREVFYELIGNSTVARSLRARGYTYVHVSSGWAATQSSKIADRLVNTAVDDEYDNAFLAGTMARGAVKRRETRNQRDRVFAAFGALQSVTDAERPAFVFAHVLTPHPPYVFRANGSDPHIDMDSLSGDWPGVVAAYTDQLKYVNGLVLRTAAGIKAKEKGRPFVIIVQGDHGPNFALPGKTTKPEDMYTRKHSILWAIYCSDGSPKSLPGFSSVDTFRYVFDRYFGTKLGMVPFVAHYSASEKWPYWPKDVTAVVEGSKP